MSKTHLSKLPEEIMVTIFSLLPPQDLKSVMLVCKELVGSPCKGKREQEFNKSAGRELNKLAIAGC